MESCPEAQTLEQVMEWLIAHEDELEEAVASNPNPTNDSTSKENGKTGEESKTSNDSNEKSNQDDKDGSNKKKITVEEAQRLINERQAKRVEEERKKEIENEKRRRTDGQKMAEVRAELQNQEMVNLAQQIRKEKLEKELHRKRVLEQIARDREAMKQKSSVPSTSNQSPQSSSSKQPIANKNSNPATECRIALRFPDGSNLVHKFSPKEQLSAVRLYAQMEKDFSTPIEFIAPPGRKLSEEMMNQTLESLGLCPASRLEVKYMDIATYSD